MNRVVLLSVLQGRLHQPEYAFVGVATVLVGRAEQCHLRIPHIKENDRVSQQHCEIRIGPHQITLIDTSTNGTFLNNRRLPRGEEVPLNDRDRLQLSCESLGHVLRFTVRLLSPVACQLCSGWLDGEQILACRRSGSGPRCSACDSPETPGPQTVPTQLHMPGGCSNCWTSLPTVRAEQEHPLREVLCAGCEEVPYALARVVIAGDPSFREWTLEELLGQGGMGAVFLVREANTGRREAVKLMLPRAANDPKGRAMFEREMKNMNQLDHVHTVRARRIDCYRGILYLTMNYYQRGSLEQLVRIRGPLPICEAVPLALQILQGLEYLHALTVRDVALADGGTADSTGMVHRDLKPANVLIDDDGSVRVADFGLAKAYALAGQSGLTQEGEVLGTYSYMPRQQMMNALKAGPEVDVWAAAATLYYLLTAKTPRLFPTGVNAFEVFNQPPTPVKRHRPDLPDSLAQLIDDALDDEDKTLKYGQATELRQALKFVV